MDDQEFVEDWLVRWKEATVSEVGRVGACGALSYLVPARLLYSAGFMHLYAISTCFIVSLSAKSFLKPYPKLPLVSAVGFWETGWTGQGLSAPGPRGRDGASRLRSGTLLEGCRCDSH